MHTQVRLRRPPRVFAVILILIGLTLAVGGVRLVTLGGSFYYVLAGFAVLASGVLLWRRDRRGSLLYGLLLDRNLAVEPLRSRRRSLGARAAPARACSSSVRGSLRRGCGARCIRRGAAAVVRPSRQRRGARWNRRRRRDGRASSARVLRFRRTRQSHRAATERGASGRDARRRRRSRPAPIGRTTATRPPELAMCGSISSRRTTSASCRRSGTTAPAAAARSRRRRSRSAICCTRAPAATSSWRSMPRPGAALASSIRK